MCNEKLESPGTTKKKWNDLINNIEIYEKEAIKTITEYLDKDDLYKFIVNTYELSVVPPSIFHKLAAIYSGTYKGMTVKITPNELLDMWKRKLNYLNRIYDKKVSTGNTFEKAGRVNYDLSVLISKYDSYLEWKEQQEILERDNNEIHKKILKNVNLQNISKQNSKKNIKSEDIDDLLDEIFD